MNQNFNQNQFRIGSNIKTHKESDLDDDCWLLTGFWLNISALWSVSN